MVKLGSSLEKQIFGPVLRHRGRCPAARLRRTLGIRDAHSMGGAQDAAARRSIRRKKRGGRDHLKDISDTSPAI
jgi:hypothetical protein